MLRRAMVRRLVSARPCGYATDVRKLPIGIQDFGKLRSGGYRYVDKTETIYRLVTEGAVYFLSRPQRFGKSLLLSTLAELFAGKRELFEGLWIAEPHARIEPWAFEPGPVVRLDMNAAYYRQGSRYLKELLAAQIERAEAEHGLSSARDESEPKRLAWLLSELHRKTGKRVAVLVDEYDKPLLETLEDPALQAEMRGILKAFNGVLKSADKHIRFTLITGVTKFSQVSIFSDLNHLNDISLDLPYATLCGITQAELERDFEPEIAAYGEAQFGDIEGHQVQRVRTLEALREWYDGYRFHPKASHVYNPFSTLCALQKSEPRNYWFQTGTPTFLVRLLARYSMPVEDLEGVKVTEGAFAEINPDAQEPIPVLFQAGYLTIREYQAELSSYVLGYPNREVRQGFMEHLADEFARVGSPQRGSTVIELSQAVLDGRVDDFLTQLRAFFANIPYDLHIPRERYYQTIFYLVFRLIGFNVQAEVKQAAGRVDAIVETDARVYLFEFKLDRASAEDALKQIDDKGYSTPYLGSSKQVVKVGVAFDSELKNIERWVVG